MRVAAIQHDIVWHDPTANFERLAPQVAGAAGLGAELILLTEMFSTGFGVETASIAEAPGGPSTQFLEEHASAHNCWIGASLPEQDTNGGLPHNTFVLAGPGGELHRYHKIHPFSYAHEHEYFAPGTDYVVVTIAGVRFGLFVCYDLRFADEFWAVARDVDAYLVPANWPEARRHHWRSLLVARAIENQAYVIGCNRVGEAPGPLRYSGDSMIVDPLGEVLASASGVESILVSDVTPGVVSTVRGRYPFLADRR